MENLKEFNNNLEIVNLKNKKFGTPDKYVKVSGFGFKHKTKGFLVFTTSIKLDIPIVPYSPRGGHKALQNIMAQGGFLDIECFSFVNEMV